MRRAALAVMLAALSLGAAGPSPGERPPTERPALGPPELGLVAPQELEPGSAAGLHVELSEPLGMSESRPLPGVEIVASLKGAGAAVPLGSARTDAGGGADLRFTVPSLPDGPATLLVEARAPRAPLPRSVQVTLGRRGKVLLTTDKPLYQPGQVIELRALGLLAQSGAPLAGQAIFEVEDSKGVKLFKERVALSAFGVAATRMRLADDLGLGSWRTRVTVVAGGKELATATRSIEVRRYTLPKFELTVLADRRFAQPGEELAVEVSARYFFGKPVQGKVTLTSRLQGGGLGTTARLSAEGKKRFPLTVPAPDGEEGTLQLEVEVEDGAGHVERSATTVIVSAKPLRVALVPESGELRPGLPNQLHAVVTTPDGTPQGARLALTFGGARLEADADAAGVATFTVTPPASGRDDGRFRDGGQRQTVDATIRAATPSGVVAVFSRQLPLRPGPAILARPAKVLARGGEELAVELVGPPEAGSAGLELWKAGQLVASVSVPLVAGAGRGSLLLPEAGGTLELRAAAALPGGATARDARVVHVTPARRLEVSLAPDRESYAPGEEATVKLRVLQGGSGVAAAVGITAVDESIYALQELKPGLERAFFTVALELARPAFWSSRRAPTELEESVRADDRTALRERLTRVLLAAAELPAPPGARLDPRVERQQKLAQQRPALTSALARCQGCLARSGRSYRFAGGVAAALQRAVKQGVLPAAYEHDLFGQRWTDAGFVASFPELSPEQLGKSHDRQLLPQLWTALTLLSAAKPSRLDLEGPELMKELAASGLAEGLTDLGGGPYRLEELQRFPGFGKRELAIGATGHRAQLVRLAVQEYAGRSRNDGTPIYYSDRASAYFPPADVVARCVKAGMLTENDTLDFWGTPIGVEGTRRADRAVEEPEWRFVRITSAGPDREAGTGDDLDLSGGRAWAGYRRLLARLSPGTDSTYPDVWAYQGSGPGRGRLGMMSTFGSGTGVGMAFGAGGLGLKGTGAGGGGFGGALAGGVLRADRAPAAAARPAMAPPRDDAHRKTATAAAPVQEAVVERIREWFPETLLFAPHVLTDAKGEATIKLPLADSITTWRVSALASGADGALGSTQLPLRVFQDFFVDLDLPPTLTQGDEVAVPVAVYNYLPGAQRLRLTLAGDDGLTLLGATEQFLEIGPGEVKGTTFRVRAVRPGPRTFELTARGERKSDAVRRTIRVEPDGEKSQQVVNRELGSGGSFDFDIPEGAIADASGISLKVYPGVVAQLADGVEGLLRSPGG